MSQREEFDKSSACQPVEGEGLIEQLRETLVNMDDTGYGAMHGDIIKRAADWIEKLERENLELTLALGHPPADTSVPSSTAFLPEGERKSLAGQAIEMAISALRDIQRRAPGTRTFFDYEAFIERELVPAMAMADKDRQGCIGLMGLLAKEKLKVEELSKPVSATPNMLKAALRDIVAPFDLLNPNLTPRPAKDVMREIAEAIKKHSAIVALAAPEVGSGVEP